MRPHRRISFVLWSVVALGCGDDGSAGSATTFGDGSTTDATASTTTASTTSSTTSTSSSTTTDASSSGGAGEDPSYPRPTPVDEAGTCPGDAFGPITFDGDGWVCLPACTGDPATCPEPGSGDADAECATNPMSSSDPCQDSTDCTVAAEMCGNIGGNQRGCLLPPSHCLLRCDEGQTCPDGMTCATGPGVCQY